MRIMEASFSGPLPPPAMLETYNQLIPDGANRMMALVEQQTAHRLALEDKIVESKIKIATRGQAIAAFLSSCLIVAAVYLGMHGHDWLGASLGVTTIIALAVIFALGKEPSKTSTSKSVEPQKRPIQPAKSSRRNR
jgi:uncharacterized membrane protein